MVMFLMAVKDHPTSGTIVAFLLLLVMLYAIFSGLKKEDDTDQWGDY